MVNATLSTDDQAMGRLTPEDVSIRCALDSHEVANQCAS